MRLEHLIDVVGGRIQIASLDVGMHVEHRANIQLRGHHGHRFATEGCQIQQQLPRRSPGSRGHRHGLQILR